jgi:hypothetical protein
MKNLDSVKLTNGANVQIARTILGCKKRYFIPRKYNSAKFSRSTKE